MADYIIGTSDTYFNFRDRFGASKLDILVLPESGAKVFYAFGKNDKIRKTDLLFNVDSATKNDKNQIILIEGAGSTINIADFRLDDRLALRNSVNEIVAFATVAEINSADLVVELERFVIGEVDDLLPIIDHIDLPADNYFSETRPSTLDSTKTHFLILAADTEVSVDINIQNQILKKNF